MIDLVHNLGIFGPAFVLSAILLARWLWILSFRRRPLSHYFAYLAATLYPFLFAFFVSTRCALHGFYDLGMRGTANPGPSVLAGDLTQLLSCLALGSFLTCIFFPLGIVVLLLRRDEEPRPET